MGKEEKFVKSYKFRIYPNKIQEQFINFNIGCARLIRNNCLAEAMHYQQEYLEARKNFYENPENANEKFTSNIPFVTSERSFGCVNSGFTTPSMYRKTLTNDRGEYFLKDAISSALNIASEEAAKSILDCRKNGGEPQYRKRREYGSFSIQGDGKYIDVDYDTNRLLLPKFTSRWNTHGGVVPGLIKIKLHRDIRMENNPHKIVGATVSKDSKGHYYVSLTVRYKYKPDLDFDKTHKDVGLKIGTNEHVLVTSDGIYYKNAAMRESIRKLDERIMELDRKISACKKVVDEKTGKEHISNNCKKLHQKKNILLAKKSRIIENALHEISKELVKNYDSIYIDGLAIKDMKEQRQASNEDMTNDTVNMLNKKTSDSSPGKLRAMIKYKADMYGKDCYEIKTNFPSTRICSECGYIETDTKKGKDGKTWKCPSCGCEKNYMQNAAENILNEGHNIEVDPKTYKEENDALKKMTQAKKKENISRIYELIKQYNKDAAEDDRIVCPAKKINSLALAMAKSSDEKGDDEIITSLKNMTSSKKRKH